MLLITHYQRILNYITPDRVHVMYRGRIIKSGGADLALEIEASGYDQIISELGGEDGDAAPSAREPSPAERAFAESQHLEATRENK